MAHPPHLPGPCGPGERHSLVPVAGEKAGEILLRRGLRRLPHAWFLPQKVKAPGLPGTMTSGNLRYLLALYRLEGQQGVRSVAMARALGLKKPSVCRMLGNLRDLGLVDKDAYGAAFLTPAGRDLAGRYCRYYQAVARWIQGEFPHSGDLEGPVCALLLELPEESLRRFQLRAEQEGERL